MKKITKKFLAALLCIFCFNNCASADLAGRINKIIHQKSQRKVQYSINIVKADSAETIYKYNANKPLIPASNMKVVASAAALKILGPKYEYKTTVGLCGNTLVVIGSGDPLLGDKLTDKKYNRKHLWILDDITEKLKQKGLTAINNIIVDSTIFDDQLVHPNWPKDQLNRHYACEVSGLNFNGNCVEITANNIKNKILLTVEPPTDYVKIKNKVRPIKKGKSAIGAYRNQTPNHLIIKGKCKKQAGPFKTAIQRPPAFFGFLLAEKLAKAGIETKGQLIEKSIDPDCKFKKLAVYKTSIIDCLNRCNKDSFALAAEALLKTIAAKNTKKTNASWEKARQIIHQYLQKLNIDRSQFYIDDARGLSRKNKLSANTITAVLLNTYKNKNWQIFKNSLAVAATDGTIKKFFKEKRYRGKVFGKTGYISTVKTFSGLCSTKNGDYIFAILANNANGKTRKAINDIVKTIIDHN